MWSINKVEYMATSDTPWFWYFLADCGGWHKFEDDPYNPLRSDHIEVFYRGNPKMVVDISLCNRHSRIDFSAMLHTDLGTGGQRRLLRGNVERSCSCFSAAPVFWEKVDPTCPYQLIHLSEHTPEYQTVVNYVKIDGLLDKSIVSISRIQNLDLWDIFCRKKMQILRLLGVQEIQERRLFHGTQIKNVDSICKYNFDLRLSGDGLYGKGIYFAKYAAYADTYSRSSTNPLPLYGGGTQDGQSIKIIFLARVIIGQSTVGQRHYKKPDDGSLENIHYSCVDDIINPKIFVVFDPNQIYPEYLIQYR